VLDHVSGGVDHAIETSGIESVMAQAMASLCRTGTLAMIGIRAFDTQVPIGLIDLLAGRTVRGVAAGDAVPQEFIPMLLRHWQAGRFPVDRMTTTFPFARIAEALKAMYDAAVIKPVLLMDTH
jgi:aryl-alcohol dehydrogenase